MNIFVSHTTKDNRDFELAHKLVEGLKAAGVIAWIAPESIPAGDSWEEKLVGTILNDCSHFLVILSESSVRSEWVQKEITLALSRIDTGLRILQLRTGKLPSFQSDDLLEKFQELPYHNLFSKQLTALLEALALPPIVPALFRTLIAELTKHFTGREHVFAAIGEFLANGSKGYFTIIGDPGEGKSTILAEYVRRTGCPAHFNIALGGINSGEQLYESLKTQLGVRYDVIPSSRDGERPALSMKITDLLEKAAQAIPPAERLVIVIDALDEAKQDEGDDQTNILGLPPILPDRVFLLVSRRRKDLKLTILDRQAEYDLRNSQLENRRDIERYLRKRLAEPELAAWLEKRGISIEQGIEELTHHSENNFMYLHHILIDLATGGFSKPTDTLPTGLKAYYLYHWRKMGMDQLPVAQLKLDVLYILSLLREPLSVRLLAEITGVKTNEIRPIIISWKEFLHPVMVQNETCYRLYHYSFQEFLHSKEVLQQDVDTSRYNDLIHEYFTSRLFS